MVSVTIRAALMAATIASVAAEQFVMYTPGGDDTVVERIDPILTPGKIASHVHQVFGANGLSPDMSYDSLQKSTCTTVGAANGDANAADHSVYWHPALYMKAKNGTGMVRIPTNGHKMYYKKVGNKDDKLADPFEFPKGFRMIAGDQLMRAADSDKKRQDITQWVCHGPNMFNQGDGGGFPSNVNDCSSYPGFNGAIHFPHCWNGEDFNQSSPTAHTSYPDGDIQGGPCPASHPIRLPHIFMENQFDLHAVVDQVVPNTFTLAQGDPTGFGWHADFFNGWEAGAIPALFNQCPQPYYGNEDVGTCSNMKRGGKTKDCQLKTSFVEKVSDPGNALPGCNPIQRTNPAIKFAIAALGVITNDCSKANTGNNAGSGSGAANSAPAGSSAPSPSSSKPLIPALTNLPKLSLDKIESFPALAPSSFFTVSTKSPGAANDHAHAPAPTPAVAEAYGATVVVHDIVTAVVTQYVTVNARHVRDHLHAHARRRS